MNELTGTIRGGVADAKRFQLNGLIMLGEHRESLLPVFRPGGLSGQWAGWGPDPAGNGPGGDPGLLRNRDGHCVGGLPQVKRLKKILVRSVGGISDFFSGVRAWAV